MFLYRVLPKVGIVFAHVLKCHIPMGPSFAWESGPCGCEEVGVGNARSLQNPLNRWHRGVSVFNNNPEDKRGYAKLMPLTNASQARASGFGRI